MLPTSLASLALRVASLLRLLALVGALMRAASGAEPKPDALYATATAISGSPAFYLHPAHRPRDARDAEEHAAALVVAVEWHESRFDVAAVSATEDYGLMQVHGRPDLLRDAAAGVREGIELLRWSLRTSCPEHPLAAYAVGTAACSSERGRRMSDEMTGLAQRLLDRVRRDEREDVRVDAGSGRL